ncbi:phospholipase A2 inhibitor and Ly6/PLAUR domain-containing protein-like [Pleurodeles waltl]|uniref:phospholipase A2 inhibitor and Ly6/PLAUR domain-containing protein-like n=1 Tax=Pleurodeles waltl TaxID=8319 RepID=UPI0037093959
MRSFAAVASLFLFFIAAGTAIECEVCSSRAGTDCSGELVTCVQTVERCQTTITEYSAEGKQSVYNVFKNCSGVEAKNTMYRSATKHAFYQLRIEICQTPGCNKGPLQFPPVNSTLNGVKCPSCAVDGALGCEATEVVECFGELTNCIYLAATFRLPAASPVKSAYRGCTSAESVKHYPKGPAQKAQDVATLVVSKGV